MFIELLLFLLPLAYSPGPGNLFFATLAARSGLPAIWRSLAGYHVATWLITFAIGAGFHQILTQLPRVFQLIEIVGACYVVWLGLRLFCAQNRLALTINQPEHGFCTGVALLILNPKAYAILGVFWSQFSAAEGHSSLMHLWRLTTFFTLNNAVAFVVWASIGHTIHQIQPHYIDSLTKLLSLSLIGVGVALLLS